jgi:hypothetical protein
MSYMLYEVWAEEEDGHQELLDTTASQKEAFEIAENALGLGYLVGIVYQEDEEGDLKEIKRFEHG